MSSPNQMTDRELMVEGVDFDTLNKAISELETVVRPLSDFFGRFGGN